MRYMVSFKIVAGHQEEVSALIPGERAHIAQLKESGTVEELYLGFEGGGIGWIVMKGESKEAIEKELESFPLHPYLALEIATLA